MISDINILPCEDTKKFRYCLQVLSPAEVKVMCWFPVLTYYLPIFLCPCASWSIPLLNIFPNTSYWCFLFLTSSQLPGFCFFFYYYFEYTFINMKHLKHGIFRKILQTHIWFLWTCMHSELESCFYFTPF